MLLSACEFWNNALMPTSSGAPVGAYTGAGPVVDTTPPGSPTGTLVGQKVIEIRSDLARLQTAVNQQSIRQAQLRYDAQQHSAAYQATVGGINGKLQLGTTPGNPGLTTAWRDAQGRLNAIDGDLAEMNALSNDVSNNAAFASYLMNSIRASYSVSGAVDEDHRQLRILEDQTNQTTVTVDRLLNQLSEDINRQNQFVSTERSNLTNLASAINNGEYYGSTLASRTVAPPAMPTMPAGAGMSTGRPLVVIRFDRPNVSYEQALYKATSKALEMRPNAGFDVVGVAPINGSPAQVALNSDIARTNADKVMRSLLNMGMPADRISVSQVSDPNAQVNEVHLYVR